MGVVLQDLRFAVRVLRKSPWVTAIAVLTLALGIGGNTVIFSIVNGILLKPMSFEEPDRIVQLQRSFPDGQAPYTSTAKFRYWSENSTGFEAVSAWDGLGSGFNMSGVAGPPERILGSQVSWQFLRVFGAAPALGRDFSREDDAVGAPRTLILSHGLWQRRFGGDADILGRKLRFNGEPFEVIGVAPAGFAVPETAQMWTPFQLDLSDQSIANHLMVTARLKPEVGLEAARAEMQVVAQQFLQEHAGEGHSPRESISVVPFQEFLYGGFRPALLIMLAAVGLVLLIACANVANLQLARSSARAKEIAIRSALGARTRRVFRQLITESALLSLAGGAAGLLISLFGLRPLLSMSPMDVPRLGEVAIDGTVLLFTLGVALATGVLFGLAPAVQASRVDFNEALKEGSLRASSGRSGGRMRFALVIGQVAMAVVLMIGASLLLRSFFNLRSIHPGFNSENVLTQKMSLPAKYSAPDALGRFERQVLDEVRGLPGVSYAAMAASLPFQIGADMPLSVMGREPERQPQISPLYRPVSDGFFEVLEIPLVRGRNLQRSDHDQSELVAVINQNAAEAIWPGEDPIGQSIRIGWPLLPELADPAPRRIVGIVGDVREQGLDSPLSPMVYIPSSQMPRNFSQLLVQRLPVSLAVKTQGPPHDLIQAIQSKVWSVDPEQPLFNALLMDEIMARSLGTREFNMLLLGVLAAVALVLASVGIYGVLSYLVAQRTREIGIRIALGAGRSRIVGLVVFQSMRAALVGIGLGLAAALFLTRFMASLLSGVGAMDLVSFLAVPALFALVALAAACIPALRASEVDPNTALRWE